MITIIDFDLTILKTRELDKDISGSLGISFEEYRELVIEIFANNTKNFNDNILLEKLENRKVIDRHKHKRIKAEIVGYLENINNYIFPETEELLNLLKEKGRIVLLTCGDNEWQGRKVEHLKFKDIFNEIIISPSSEKKAMYLENYKNEDRHIYINDNAKELIKAKEILPQAKIFLVKSEYSKNADYSGIKEYTHAELIERIKVL